MTAAEQLIAEGVAKGHRELLLHLLNTRFPGEVTPEVENRIQSANKAQVEAWAGHIATATGLEDVFTSN